MNFNRIKKMVVVYDEAGTGKTTSLCMLCENLIKKSQISEFVLQKKGNKKRLLALPINKNGAYQDILCAVHCKDKAGKNVLVGIVTAGNNWDAVEQNFMFFESVFPEKEFAYVFIAIRKQDRLDGLGVAAKSFPLMALERKESEGLMNVIRSFVNTSNATRLPKNASVTQKPQFNKNCQNLARKLEKMI